MKIQKRTFALLFYFLLLVMPIYWMLNMSLRSNADILSVFSLYPSNITFDNYIKVFTDPTWYSGYINAMIYVSLNTSCPWPLRCRRPMPFHGINFWVTGRCFSGC
jgi:glycerol transport system permease protein